jgi:hypothetical protein
MKVHGDYHKDGYAHLEGLIAPEIAMALLATMERDLAAQNLSYDHFGMRQALTRDVTVELPGHSYPPLITFLWGLTPIVSHLVGRELLPSFDYFRIYQKGDICRLHADRPACEHSLSLTLTYSDGLVWPLDMGTTKVDKPGEPGVATEAFAGEPHTSIPMQPGDAVLYKGVEHRHGRVTPNPNATSAHLFLHFVDREGPYRDHAFDAARFQEVGARPGAAAI